MMKQVLILFSTFTVLLLFHRCEKEDFAKTGKVNFEFRLNTNQNDEGYLAFNRGRLNIRDFGFDGDRQNASGVFFESRYDSGFITTWEMAGDIFPLLEFDIPQGLYTLIEVSIKLFDDGIQLGLWVEGIYTKIDGSQIPVRVEIDGNPTYKIIAESINGGREIVLSKDIVSNAFVEFNPTMWFSTISRNSLESAELTDINGVLTIIIADKENDFIYEIVENSVEKSIKVIF